MIKLLALVTEYGYGTVTKQLDIEKIINDFQIWPHDQWPAFISPTKSNQILHSFENRDTKQRLFIPGTQHKIKGQARSIRGQCWEIFC